MDDNWIVENLESPFHTWNEKLTEIWSLVSETPQQFKGGAIWDLAQNINAALQAKKVVARRKILCKRNSTKSSIVL